MVELLATMKSVLLVIMLLKMRLDVESLVVKQVTVLLVDQLRQFEKIFWSHQTFRTDGGAVVNDEVGDNVVENERLDVELLVVKQVTVLLVDQLRQFEKIFWFHQTLLCKGAGHNLQ